jgi:mannose-6-phosphate isomerase-like protein (cupin superfamily)
MADVVPFGDLAGDPERAYKFEGADFGSTVSGFISSHRPGQGPQLHRHPYEETFICLEGEATFEAAGEKIVVGPGHIVVVPAGAAHRFENTGQTPLRQVSIHPNERVEQEDL